MLDLIASYKTTAKAKNRGLFHTGAYVCRINFERKKCESIFHTKAYVYRINSNPIRLQGRVVPHNRHLSAQQTQHTTLKIQKNTTMIPPGCRLPVAPILQVHVIALCFTMAHDLRKTAMIRFLG
jgi:hypothetical protein